jgi:ubiquitin C-terminal hydrolase
LSYEIEVEIEGTVKTKSDHLMKKSLEKWKSHYEKEYSIITQVFDGMFYNTVSCNHCKNTEYIFEPFNVVSLDIVSNNSTCSLHDCLSNTFVDKETIDTWTCEKCNGDLGCQRSSYLWSVPDYFIVHLKRFSSTSKQSTSSKIQTHVTFPIDDLDLTEYISKDKNDKNNYIYSLYAVNYHSGLIDNGHYWSCCRNIDNNWYMFNDGHVSKFHNVADLVSKDAYILFYYRKYIRTPIQI